MSYSLDKTEKNCLLKNLRKYDIIKFGSVNIPLDYYMVYSLELDNNIPALFLQLWRLEGGYDHSFVNLIENDFGINKQVPLFSPKKYNGRIQKITSYRPRDSGYSDKEEFYFDVWPKSESKVKNSDHSIPFKCNIQINNKNYELIIPSWTPIQKLPVERIKEGSYVETWGIQNNVIIMKVIKL